MALTLVLGLALALALGTDPNSWSRRGAGSLGSCQQSSSYSAPETQYLSRPDNLIRSHPQPSPVCHSAEGLFPCTSSAPCRSGSVTHQCVDDGKVNHSTTAIPASAHHARDDPHLRSKVQIQIGAFGCHIQHNEGY